MGLTSQGLLKLYLPHEDAMEQAQVKLSRERKAAARSAIRDFGAAASQAQQ